MGIHRPIRRRFCRASARGMRAAPRRSWRRGRKPLRPWGRLAPAAALLIARRDADAHVLQTAGALRERSAKRYVLFEFKALALSRGWISAVELRHSKPTGIFTAQGYRRPLHPNESGLRISLGRNRPGRLRARIDFAVAAREHDAGFCDGTIRESQPERFGLYPQWGASLSRF